LPKIIKIIKSLNFIYAFKYIQLYSSKTTAYKQRTTAADKQTYKQL